MPCTVDGVSRNDRVVVGRKHSEVAGVEQQQALNNTGWLIVQLSEKIQAQKRILAGGLSRSRTCIVPSSSKSRRNVLLSGREVSKWEANNKHHQHTKMDRYLTSSGSTLHAEYSGAAHLSCVSVFPSALYARFNFDTCGSGTGCL
ncbi:hypothetical protein M404DRAFT_991994 [Pisolithus tinctorius Marx 270]|uniref:Uncharacterized protein n=1 Tax=Pisolithus tinctorius Marx 270 TaxID=870435 RepID=A0A0C3PZF8_PISTI|nr:hypothetical protein M404DRAFT_991994 [Pisolithus tinctorius Marx 270]